MANKTERPKPKLTKPLKVIAKRGSRAVVDPTSKVIVSRTTDPNSFRSTYNVPDISKKTISRRGKTAVVKKKGSISFRSHGKFGVNPKDQADY